MPRLYIVEGLPCSGKSTAAAFVSRMLTETGQRVCCVDEGSGDHPADYEFHAFIRPGELAAFDPALQAKIKACSGERLGGHIVPLADFTGEERICLLPYKIYDFLPWETEKPVMLDKWSRFAENAEEDTVYVFNCVFLQNPMCETMMRLDQTEEQSAEYISEILEIIRPLDPAVIYLKNDDIAQRVKKTAKERGGWLNGVIDYHVNGGYGKRVRAWGFDGYIACLEERQRRELSILDQLCVKKTVIDNAHRAWNAAYEQIHGFLKEL